VCVCVCAVHSLIINQSLACSACGTAQGAEAGPRENMRLNGHKGKSMWTVLRQGKLWRGRSRSATTPPST
jgi:hypothetical protein